MEPKLAPPQIPQDPRYLIIGGGRVARHFQYYFTQLAIPWAGWSRKESKKEDLAPLIAASDVVLLLISDDSILPFIKENPVLRTKGLVHFSGALTTPDAFGAHPLNTFTPGKYSLEAYKQTAFVCDEGPYTFSQLFPELPNPSFTLKAEEKAYYHALCVAAGNFTVLLWQKLFKEFETLGLPQSAALPFLSRVAANIAGAPAHVLTGPISRKDRKTIQSNIRALQGDPLERIYRAFVLAYAPELLQ